MDEPTAVTATEDRIGTICAACDFVRGVMTKAVAEGDAPAGLMEPELEQLSTLRDEALDAEAERALVLEDEMLEARAYATLGTYQQYLLDEGEVEQAALAEEVLREMEGEDDA